MAKTDEHRRARMKVLEVHYVRRYRCGYEVRSEMWEHCKCERRTRPTAIISARRKTGGHWWRAWASSRRRRARSTVYAPLATASKTASGTAGAIEPSSGSRSGPPARRATVIMCPRRANGRLRPPPTPRQWRSTSPKAFRNASDSSIAGSFQGCGSAGATKFLPPSPGMGKEAQTFMNLFIHAVALVLMVL